MCTAISFLTKDHYFGRNLDLYYSYQETVTVTPRAFPFYFRMGKTLTEHHAMVGMASVSDHYPLYYEATNEKGLSIAGLNFPGLAVYHTWIEGKVNLSPFELIPWLLGQYETVAQVHAALTQINLWNEPFSKGFPLSPLHWLISDREHSIVAEPMRDGLRVFENPIGVLTNNPTFDFHLYNLAGYMNLTRNPPENRFSDKIELQRYSLGMGSMGLPGDLSSSSRFVKAAFTKLNSLCKQEEPQSVSQFFHILSSAAQQRGLVRVEDEQYEYTLYSSCCNTDKGIYYYTTYENSQINAVDMHRCDLYAKELFLFPLVQTQKIHFQN